MKNPLNKMSLKQESGKTCELLAFCPGVLQNGKAQSLRKRTLVFNLTSQGSSPCPSQGLPPLLIILVLLPSGWLFFDSFLGGLQERPQNGIW